MRSLLVPLVALPLLLAGPSMAGSSPELVSGELAALRLALDAELVGTDYRQVEVARQLRVRRDSRAPRMQAIGRLADTWPAATPDLISSFVGRNQRRFDLWHDARLRLGERADRNSFLLAEPKTIHVQFARAGLDSTGDRLLVYLELRPYEGALRLEGVFRLLERTEDSWRLVAGRHAFSVGPPGAR